VKYIEVVIVSGATLFGRAAAAGAVNIITKTGRTTHGEHVSITRFNNVVGDDQISGIDFNPSSVIDNKLEFSDFTPTTRGESTKLLDLPLGLG